MAERRPRLPKERKATLSPERLAFASILYNALHDQPFDVTPAELFIGRRSNGQELTSWNDFKESSNPNERRNITITLDALLSVSHTPFYILSDSEKFDLATLNKNGRIGSGTALFLEIAIQGRGLEEDGVDKP